LLRTADTTFCTGATATAGAGGVGVRDSGAMVVDEATWAAGAAVTVDGDCAGVASVVDDSGSVADEEVAAGPLTVATGVLSRETVSVSSSCRGLFLPVGSVGLEPYVDVCAPPECETVTPGATSTVVAEPAVGAGVVVPVVPVVSVVSGEVGVCGPASTVDGAAVSVGEGEDPVAGAPLVVSCVAAAVESPVASGLAQATPAGVAMAVPTPSATARAPTRPTKLLYCMAHDPIALLRTPAIADAIAGR
jgi:hypothetical protein